ncbi:hypothetical protein HK098_006509 [Nowakowskiella sp. JEL0407]|nr:hypothetical protein HK098_006509 [Nowakowskiella sp. JEL0407]
MSALPLSEYIARNPSKFSLYINKPNFQKQLLNNSRLVLTNILPSSEQSSEIVMSLLVEVLATSVFQQSIEKFAEPDYINLMIVQFLNSKKKEQQDAFGVVPKNRISTPQSIFVKVVEGRRLPIQGSGGFSLTLMCGKKVSKTRKVKPDANPLWAEEFHFEYTPETNQLQGIIIDVYDSKILVDDLIGSILIPLSELPPNKYIKKWFSIDTSESKKHKVHVESELFLEILHIVTDIDAHDDTDDDSIYERGRQREPRVDVEIAEEPEQLIEPEEESEKDENTIYEIDVKSVYKDETNHSIPEPDSPISNTTTEHAASANHSPPKSLISITTTSDIPNTIDEERYNSIEEEINSIRSQIQKIDSSVTNPETPASEVSQQMAVKHMLQERLVVLLDQQVEVQEELYPPVVGLQLKVLDISDERRNYLIQIEFDGNGWMVMRGWDEFQRLSTTLGVNLEPQNSSGSSSSTNGDLEPEEQLTAITVEDLEKWLRFVLENNLGKHVYEFFNLDKYAKVSHSERNDSRDSAEEDRVKPSQGLGIVSTAVTTKRVIGAGLGAGLGALRYTGSVLKKGVVSSVSTVSSVARGKSRSASVSSEKSEKFEKPEKTEKLTEKFEDEATKKKNTFIINPRKQSLEQYSKKPSTTQLLNSQQPPSTPPLPPQQLPSEETKQPHKPKISPSDLEMLMECIFAFLEEIFIPTSMDVDIDKWFRQKGLHTVKNLLRRTYGTYISEMIGEKIVLNDDRVAGMIENIDKRFWPGGVWYSTSQPSSKNPPRTEQEKLDTKGLAKQLFVTEVPALLNISTIVGPYNCETGLNRLFNMLQEKELNKNLIVEILDSLIEAVFSEVEDDDEDEMSDGEAENEYEM